ncbi:hypothetical protein HYT33_04525 [Candidatus Roizmanbacteria bacterium]|nr:hypothetical protein [Candidatus Roizmanbacteria bacterium]
MMNFKSPYHLIGIIIVSISLGVFFAFVSSDKDGSGVNPTRAAKFARLSKNGNSSCSGAFQASIPSMSDTARIQGSCCSPMSLHRYSEQVEGLVKYKNIREIPSDPYDIEARLAKQLLAYYDDELTPTQQKAYDYAMQNSSEKGPCCCRCWRWYVYGGLGKVLIKKYNFTKEELTRVWDLSDGCGGDEEHHHG